MMEDEKSGSTGTLSDDRGIPECTNYVALVYQVAYTALMIGMQWRIQDL